MTSIDSINVFSGIQADQSLAENASLEDAAKQFEGMMMKMMVKQMRKTIPDGMFSGGGADMFEDLFDEQLVEQLMADGGGFGLADALVNDGVPQLQTTLPNGFELGGTTSAGERSAAERMGASWPIASDRAAISSSFGHRVDPISGHEAEHHGLDIAAPEGTPISAISGGVVTFAGERGGYGNVVEIDHGDGVTSRYAHCAELFVEEGARIRDGEEIATVGSTGRSTGPHLHLEVLEDGDHLDPESLFSTPRGSFF